MAHVDSLRSALAEIENDPAQFAQTDHLVDPNAELAGVYRHVGAGGTVRRPTKRGPAMMFTNVAGYPDARVLVGVMADRARVARLLETTPTELAHTMVHAIDNAMAPVVSTEPAPCQEVVYRADEPGFDIRKLIPAPTNTPEDAGPYFCLGLLAGTDPETGHSDVTIHRICVQDSDKLSIFFAPDRHIDAFRIKAEQKGQPLPVSISMGLDPAVYIGACFEAPTTPLGYDELQIAGGLRGKPVELVKCQTINQVAIANAEIVIEGELLPNTRIAEDASTGTGRAMPEYPGYTGPAVEVPVMRVTAVTTRVKPIMQTLVGPGEEHTSLAGIPLEASVSKALDAALPGLVKGVYAHTAGGGKLLLVISVHKKRAFDDGLTRQAAIVSLASFRELKNVILVDDDVDIFDTNDVLWAMTTRMQGNRDIITIPGLSGHVLDPSQQPFYDPTLPAPGTTSKTIFDATVPFALQDRFQRAAFKDVDPRPWSPDTPYQL